jgi:hypothetical protein
MDTVDSWQAIVKGHDAHWSGCAVVCRAIASGAPIL